MNRPSFWAWNKLIVLVLAGGFLLLGLEVRSLHDNVLDDHKIAWTPIVFSGLMALLIVVALPFWERGGRRVLLGAFALAPLVGLLGFWIHNEGKPVKGVARELSVWVPSLKDDSSESAMAPPALAPLSIAGLGLIGLIACAAKPPTTTTTTSDPRQAAPGAG